MELDWGEVEEVTASPTQQQQSPALPQLYPGESGAEDSWSSPPPPPPHSFRHPRGSLAGEEGAPFMRGEVGRGSNLSLVSPDPHTSSGVGREQVSPRLSCCQPARQPFPSGRLQPSPSWARRRHLDHHHHHHHHHHPSPHHVNKRARRSPPYALGCPVDRREEETGQHTHSPESSCLSSPGSHTWSSPMAESPYGAVVKREAAGGWGSASPGVGPEGVWAAEEDRYSVKRRQLAARAEQLQRAEEMVKQQEEEAQQRTWLALQQQEMLLREKEEALKLREAAAQRKMELAARLMEESRMMRESGRHGSDPPTPALCCSRRPPSPFPLPCPEDLPHQEASRAPGYHWPDTFSRPDGLPAFHNGREGGQSGLGRGRTFSAEHSRVEAQHSREASPRQQWRPGEGRSPSPRAAPPTSRQPEPGRAMATPPCYPPEARVCGASPGVLEESLPHLQTHRVVRTYSRVGRTRLLSDAALRPSQASRQSEGQLDALEETVVHEGSSITITPTTRPPSRPRRPYSALPMLQTTLTHTPDTTTSNLTVTLASPSSSRGPSPALSTASQANIPPTRELAPRQLSLPPSLNLGSQQFKLKYVGTFKPEKRERSSSTCHKMLPKTSSAACTPTCEERSQGLGGEKVEHPPTTHTLPKSASSPPRLCETYCKPGHTVVAPKVTTMGKSPAVASSSRSPGAPTEGKGLEVMDMCWQVEATSLKSNNCVPKVAVEATLPVTHASTPPPPPPLSPPLPDTQQTTQETQVDSLGTPTLQLIHGADSPFHPPQSHPPQPCHTPPLALHHQLPITHLPTSPPPATTTTTTDTPPDTQPSPEYPVFEDTPPQQETVEYSQTFTNLESVPQPSVEGAEGTAEGSHPAQDLQQDVMGQPDAFEGEAFDPPTDTLHCSSPAFMHSLLSDSVDFHSTAIPSPPTAQGPPTPSPTIEQDTPTPSPPPTSMENQDGEDESSAGEAESGVRSKDSQEHSPLLFVMSSSPDQEMLNDNEQHNTPTPESCNGEVMVTQTGEEEVDILPQHVTHEDEEDEDEEVDVTGDGTEGEDSGGLLPACPTPEAVVEGGDDTVHDSGNEDWKRLQPLTPTEEGESPVEAKSTPGQQQEENERRKEEDWSRAQDCEAQEQASYTEPVSVPVLEGDTIYQTQEVEVAEPGEQQPTALCAVQEPKEVPPSDCESEGTLPDITIFPEGMGEEDACQGVVDSGAMPTTTHRHLGEGTHTQGQNDALLSGSLNAEWHQESHMSPEVTTTEGDQSDPLTPESEERDPVSRKMAQRGRGRRGKGRSRGRGQGRWNRKRNASRNRQGHSDDVKGSSEGDLSTHHSDTMTGDCVPPRTSSDGEAAQNLVHGASLLPQTQPHNQTPPSPMSGTVDPFTQEMEHREENPGVEEAVEHVSRGGRKVKLKEWWTGVVGEATSPRTKGTARSPVTSPVRSPRRSPCNRKPRMKRSPAEASEVPEPKRKCEEGTPETDLQATTTTITTTSTTTPTVTTPATTPTVTTPATTPQPRGMKMVADPFTTFTPSPPRVSGPPPDSAPDPSSAPPAIIKKRRGRQPKRQRRVKEYKPNPNEEKKDLECGQCGEQCHSQSHFLSHARMNHNGLARPKGESQEFSAAETQDILADTMRAVKQVKCEVCNNIFRSLLGYRMHSLACGMDPSQLNQTCDVCQRRIRYYYMEAHLRKHAKQDAKKEAPTKERGSRKAAQTCNMRLQAWRSSKVDDEASEGGSDPGDDYCQELNLTQYYTRPNPILPPNLLSGWEASLEEGSGAACNHEGCTHSATTLAEARQHYWVCALAGHSLAFTCKLCSFTCKKEEDMEDHLTTTHTEDVVGEPEDSEYEASDDEWGEGSMTQRTYRRSSKDALVPFLPAMRWTYDFLTENTCDILFPELAPQQEAWLALPDAIAAPYLPAVIISPKFKVHLVKKGKEATPINGEVPAKAEWQELRRFKSVPAGQGSAMFCGGPVTASAWCPECPRSSLTSSMQYLALATLSSPDMEHQIYRSYSHVGLIQLWGCPGPATDAPATPSFVLGLGHDHGTVWSLAWCPSGSDEATLPGQAEASLPRLGLLAAGCSDGTVQVYAIPRPEALEDPGRVYKPLACLSLLPGRGASREVQCFKVDWCRSKGHHLVAGALSSGVVCIWDLGTTSPFLRDQCGSVLYPFRAFHAHNGVCTTVAFCPTTGGRNLLSGGNDRTYKFWDLEHPELPLSVVRKGLVLDALWLTHWAGCFLAFDDVYGLTSTNTCFKESGFFGISSRNVLSANSAVWSLAGSDWLNSVAQGDSAGEVTLTVQQQLFRNYENEKFPSKRKVPVMCVRLQGLNAHTPISFSSTRVLHTSRHPPPKPPKKHRQEEEDDCLGQNLYREFPQTYQDTQDTYGLVFRDQNVTNFSSIPKEELLERWRNECMEASAVTCYPMMAVTSLAWNNNLGAHTWLMMATQSGIARLVKVEALHTAAMENFIQDNFRPES